MARPYTSTRLWTKQSGCCVIHGCTQPAVSRGMCKSCYDIHKRDRRSKRWAPKSRQRIKQAHKLGLCTVYGCQEAHVPASSLCQKHKETRNGRYGAAYRSVAAHLSNIEHGRSTYGGMPFFDGWSPLKGGSIKAGANWIEANIGPRPVEGNWDLHIVDRPVGFVPGNLQWLPRDTHRRNELINRVLIDMQRVAEENRLLKICIAALQKVD